MMRYDSSHRMSKKTMRKAASNSKVEHYSMHQRNIRRSEQSLDMHQAHNNLPVISCKGRAIPIYLLYKGNKFVVKSRLGMHYNELVPLLYKQIINYEVRKGIAKSKQQIIRNVRSVLGFSTVCNNLKIDYLISIMQGKVQKSLLLECFISRKLRFKGKKDKLQNFKDMHNQSFASNKSKNKLKDLKLNYEIYNCLAIGGFSKVYLARSYEDGHFYVIKFIKKKKEKQEYNRATVLNQMQISSELNHPYLIKMREGFETSKFYGMVFQYCPGGQLFFLLKKIRTISQQNARFYFIQILLGIKHIHQNNIIYRDLKPQNILIDWEGNLKIVDFGLSKKVQSSRQKTYSYCGSAEYMAPEMILRSGHNAAIDYYSLGALLFQLVTGLPPFYSKNQQQLQQSIVTEQLAFPSHLNLSPQIKDFLTHLLAKDQRYRLGSYSGIKQIIFHPWVGKFSLQEYMKKNNLKVPYPPNLEDHNFDLQQLGDDEEQFTQQIYKNFQTNSDIRHYVKSANQSGQNYEQIILNLTKYIPQEKQDNHQKTRNCFANEQSIQKVYKQSFRKQRRQNLKEIQNSFDENEAHLSNTVSVSKHTKANWKKLYKQQSFHCFKGQKDKSGRQQMGDKQNSTMKVYHKLLPYFSKNKVFKSPNKQNKKLLPRANILRLKITANEIKQESNQIQG